MVPDLFSRKHAVMKLESVKAGLASTTYISTTREIFLVDNDGRVHLYPLTPTGSFAQQTSTTRSIN